MKNILIIILFIIFTLYMMNYYLGMTMERFENDNEPSFHILLTTIGHKNLQRQVNSIIPQLKEKDHLTIVFDGVDKKDIPIEDAKCKVHVYKEDEKLGYWGHAIRNKYANKLEKTDFVMHADDDDYYLYNIFDNLRKICLDKDTLYIAKILRKKNNSEVIIPKTNEIKLGNISTQCGIIPYELNKKGEWTYEYGGDFKFYDKISKEANKIKYLDNIIYVSE